MRRVAMVAISAALLAVLPGAPASAATLMPVGSFDRPIFVTSDPQNPDRLLIVEREGRVMASEGGVVSLYGDLGSLVECCESERGLLSIAPEPDFPDSGRFYAAYTGTVAAGGAAGDIHLDAFQPAPAGAGELLREPILSVPHSALPNHNGGQLQFGPDGYLYLAVGDGGGTGDPSGNGQSLDTLLGKILRIDPHPGEEPPYGIPADNPFVGVEGRDEIWSYGLRNPWRFSFDRTSGDMLIGDVGQGLREEVDRASSPAPGVVGGRGVNYGWNCREGTIAYPGAPSPCGGTGAFTGPVFDYTHDDVGAGNAPCSITGGYVVRDTGLVDLYGRYLYADFCIGELRSLDLLGGAGGMATGDRSEGLRVPKPVSFGEDSCGRIYVASNGGEVFRLQGDLGPGCNAVATAPGPSVAPIAGTAKAGPLRLHLSARRRSATGSAVDLKARLAPCLGHGGSRVLLRRGGRPFAGKRLDRRCVAHFRPRIARRSTFRALLPSAGADPPLASRRLLVEASGGGHHPTAGD